MITHTSDSHPIPSQNERKSKLQILKNCQKFKYEMDPTRNVGTAERTRDAGRTDGRTDGVKTNIPPLNNFVVPGV